MMKVTMYKEATVAYSTLRVGDCFAYNGKAYIKVATGALMCSDGFEVVTLDSATQVIPYPNSVLTLN